MLCPAPSHASHGLPGVLAPDSHSCSSGRRSRVASASPTPRVEVWDPREARRRQPKYWITPHATQFWCVTQSGEVQSEEVNFWRFEATRSSLLFLLASSRYSTWCHAEHCFVCRSSRSQPWLVLLDKDLGMSSVSRRCNKDFQPLACLGGVQNNRTNGSRTSGNVDFVLQQ